MRERLRRDWRRLFPRSEGGGYRLFDTAGCITLVTALWYVASEPSLITATTVSETWIGALIDPRAWGASLCLIGAYGMAVSYWGSERLRHSAYLALGVGLAVWAAILILGGLWGLLLGQLPWDLTAKAWGTAVWFGYACRAITADNMRAARGSRE